MNRNFLLAFNVVLLILVGILFYLHFSSANKADTTAPVTVADSAPTAPGSFKIAYFDMDSIEKNYDYLKDVKNELKTKENQLNGQLSALKNSYMSKVTKFQQEAQTMTQERQGAMQKDLMQEQKVIQNKEQAVNGELQDESFKKMQDVNRTIEDFLKDYNKNKEYAYILGYQTGTIYYKDPKYDITSAVLKGLNDRYKSKNKE
ncbi:OmpH family outer membrane protein [Segetibacter koreensis]|uniref:OmpH family outer membrane protein n=1 Tax=Segetibacter koreensis TaxID=398037 RepID=UPI0003647985|nr:OmpH family outer membrane protein [Segetibacter koreensis]